jgi:uncharacterized membrane protein YdjX (TVP38/TMEM64 family)
MKRYKVVAVSFLAPFLILLILFLLSEALGIPLLTDPAPGLEWSGVLGALGGVGLLVVDVALPVPSSLVMVAHGALFGVAIGIILSLVGSTGAALVGFAIGRRGGPLLARLVSANERARVNRLLTRWGMLAIIVTRLVPLLAETTTIVVGSSPLGWGRMALAALAGSFPGALLYALTGAVAARLQNGVLVFGLVLLVASSFWLLGRWLAPRLIRLRQTSENTSSRQLGK